MAKRRKARIEQDKVVKMFAARLREVRRSHGVTQLELSRRANITPSYVWRLESGGASPGIDLVDRLAQALGTTTHDLLPLGPSPDTVDVLTAQARRLFETLLVSADRETLLMLNPLLARLTQTSEQGR